MMRTIQVRQVLAILAAIHVGFVSRWPWAPLFGAAAAVAVLAVAQLVRPERLD
jgi:hypothetical protein